LAIQHARCTDPQRGQSLQARIAMDVRHDGVEQGRGVRRISSRDALESLVERRVGSTLLEGRAQRMRGSIDRLADRLAESGQVSG
jgi:hypothetical protein